MDRLTIMVMAGTFIITKATTTHRHPTPSGALNNNLACNRACSIMIKEDKAEVLPLASWVVAFAASLYVLSGALSLENAAKQKFMRVAMSKKDVKSKKNVSKKLLL